MAHREQIRASQPAEWLLPKTVLVCEPNIETLFAVLETNSANFLRPFSLVQARKEHRAFRQALEAVGAHVIDLREALTWNADEDPDALDQLREWAMASVCYEYEPAVSDEDRRLLEENLRRAIEVFDPSILADLVLLRPVVTIRNNPNALDPTSRFLSRFEVRPANNAYFVRDPLITTLAGCVIGRLRLNVRRVENDIAEYALQQLGIQPIYRVEPPGFLEGGDFAPAGDFVLQGQGLLTNEDGVGQLLEHRTYGYVEVAVVKDPRSEMEEMHLDGYFALLGPDLCAVSEDRITGDLEPEVDVYRPEGSKESFSYRKVGTYGFADYLTGKDVHMLTFTEEEQQADPANVVLLGPYRFIGIRELSGLRLDETAFAGKLKDHSVQYELIDFSALACGYGGPHCSCQVIYRAN